jgi:DNA-binding GntR family transcriptional regulator
LLWTEKELALEFGVSRITVQHALDALSRQGLVDRQRARDTFVSPDVRPRGSVELHGFLDDIILMSALGETHEVDCDELAASELVASRLEIKVGTWSRACAAFEPITAYSTRGSSTMSRSTSDAGTAWASLEANA